MRKRYKPPNAPLTQADFGSRGGFEIFNAIMDNRYRIGRLEASLALLIPMTIALLGRTFGAW